MTSAALSTLRTPRLTLRPLSEDDTSAIVAGIGNYDVSKWLGNVPYPYSREDASAFLANLNPQNRPTWAIDAGAGLIGVVAGGNRLGYWLARSEWRKGYAFEACVGVLNHLFGDLGVPEIEIGHFDGNARSEAVAKALGFVAKARGTTFAQSLQQDVDSIEYTLTRRTWQDRQVIDIRSPRLRLRPVVASDASFLRDLSRPEVTRMLFSLKPDLSEEKAQAFIAARRWRGLPGYALTIERAGQPIGYVATGNMSGVALYYALHPDHWGQGLMTEAVQAFLADVFQRFPINRVVADRFEDNAASGRVLEKCGFKVTGSGLGQSAGRLEPAPVITYALTRDMLKARA